MQGLCPGLCPEIESYLRGASSPACRYQTETSGSDFALVPWSAVTVDDGPRRGRPRSTKRDLERYAGLFASRTQVMKSSAMRDLMAVTARPEVISLAGGLPDTSSFPPETFAAVAQRIARESCAKALRDGPADGTRR